MKKMLLLTICTLILLSGGCGDSDDSGSGGDQILSVNIDEMSVGTNVLEIYVGGELIGTYTGPTGGDGHTRFTTDITPGPLNISIRSGSAVVVADNVVVPQPPDYDHIWMYHYGVVRQSSGAYYSSYNPPSI